MASDARDKEISVDDYVRYVDTGTIGKVLDIKTEDEIDWVLLDKTNLWYKSKLVEVLDEKDIKVKFTPTGREFDVEELKEKVAEMENMEMDSSVAEGGG
ncbi:MAG: DUF2098 domain-containing protein [Methanobrevibacter sp.]|uniref:DUF2098 domain-containing protein n=1 Tax=Methanobrevibacter millerae TaxID=230361 RepID=A0A8T3VIC7_9EURY|nr:DUF2098 domain-containing protein [Methanobrevibacter millerae]MBE6505053.1 DUF2098 domain-containing protein [Methanobrevibacter millerae]MBR0059314.1 DUF2098 domain-containing protein [Methanobrevibacter sp.]MBR0369906.1 DUF2098 domain-containing protein [Methanobrevibacter sp.]